MNEPTKISPFVSSQLPEFVRVDHPSLVAFLNAYYEWLEQHENEIRSPMALKGVSDVDESMDRFVEQFKKQYLLNFPEQLAINQNGSPVDPRRLIKNIKAFYRAKGTEKAYRFLFRILYDAAVEFYYPKKDILRLSDGKWIQKSSIRMTNTTGSNLFSSLGSRVYQRNASGSIVASARVESITSLQIGFFEIAEVFLSGINGTFSYDKPVEFFDGEKTIQETSVLPVVANVSITNGGTGYRVGDRVLFTQAEGDIGVGAYGIVSKVSTTGAVLKIDIQNFGVNYRIAPAVSIVSAKGTGFSGTSSPTGVCAYAGYYANNDGRLSTNKVIEDNHYYQEFSYVLSSEITIDKYRDSVRKLIHPAGFGFFGQVSIGRCARGDLSNHTEIARYEVPVIGHYVPYTFKTYDDLSEWFKDDQGISVGYDSTQHDTLIIGAGGNPITNETELDPVIDDPIWIIYQHPNRRIKDPTIARIWEHDRSDFLYEGEGGTVVDATGNYEKAWHEWTLTGQHRSAWDNAFVNDYTYATLRYDNISEFRKITARSFFEMPVGVPFDCRAEKIEDPSVPKLTIKVGSLNLDPTAGATLMSNGTINYTVSIANDRNLAFYNASTIRFSVQKGSVADDSVTPVSFPLCQLTAQIRGFSSGQYTITASLYDLNGNIINNSISNTLSFGYVYNSGSSAAG